MSHDAINSWVEKAKAIVDLSDESDSDDIKVIKRPQPQSSGNAIMEVAEKIRPWLHAMFENVRDENGMLVQPARVRGIALNVAQSIVKEQTKKKASA